MRKPVLFLLGTLLLSLVPIQAQRSRPEVTELMTASENGDLDTISARLVADPTLIKATDESGGTALQAAFRNNNSGYEKLLPTVTLLLARGADPNVGDNRGQTALHAAARNLSKGNPQAVAALLEKGADPKAHDHRGSTPLHQVASPEVAKLLLDKGADANAADAMGNTPLHTTVQYHPDVVPLLVTAGADVNRRNARGDMPLHLGLRSPSRSAPAALTEKADLNARDSTGLSAVQAVLVAGNHSALDAMMARNPALDEATQVFNAAAQNDATKLRTLLDAKPHLAYARLSNGSTPLHISAQWLAPATTALLLARGADPNARNADAISPIHLAIQRTADEQKKAVRDVVALLLDKGADVNASSGQGNAPLHQAFYTGDKELFALLLERKADPNQRGWRGNTPLHMVVTEIHDNQVRQDVMEMLLTKGAELDSLGAGDTHREGPDGLTPLMLAIARLTYDNGHSLPLVRLLLEKGASLTVVDDGGNMPLAIAVQRGNKDAVALLLDKGADINARNLSAQTPIALAVRAKRTEIVDLLRAKGAKE